MGFIFFDIEKYVLIVDLWKKTNWKNGVIKYISFKRWSYIYKLAFEDVETRTLTFWIE